MNVIFISTQELGVLDGVYQRVFAGEFKRGRSSGVRKLGKTLQLLGLIPNQPVHYIGTAVNWSGETGLLIVQDINQPPIDVRNASLPGGKHGQD